MPVYVYRCENCGVEIERHRNYSDKPLKALPGMLEKYTQESDFPGTCGF